MYGTEQKSKSKRL